MKVLLSIILPGAALWISSCSGGAATIQPPPPAGKYSLANLNGQYVYVTSGEVFAAGALNATPLSRVGAFVADGAGHITNGVEDVNAAGTLTTAISILNTSVYTVNADGRGTLTLNVNAAGVQNTLQFGIVLTSTNDGLMIDETSTTAQASTGSGNFIKQKAAPFLVSDITGPYVFDFTGLDVNSAPESIVGEFTVNAAGATGSVAGVEDLNDNGNIPATPTPISFVGSVGQDTTNTTFLTNFGRGLAQLNGQQYIYYIVDGTRVRFLSQTGGMLSGDAVVQAPPPANPAALNGSFVFLVGGASANGGVTRIGRFTLSAGVVSQVELDTNNNGVFTLSGGTGGGPVSSGTLTLDPLNPGRCVVTFRDTNLAVPFTFVFYLSSANGGVIQDDAQAVGGGATDVADGTISLQSGSPFTGSNITGTYALNWSGLLQAGGNFAVQDEEDVLAQMTVTNLSSAGAADIFDFVGGIPSLDQGLSGSMAINGDGTGGDGMRSSFSVNLSGASPIHLAVYFVSPQLAFVANKDNSGAIRIVAGILKVQQ